MGKIQGYTCDFCGVGVKSLMDLEPLHLSMDATAVHQEYDYQVCSWCASTFKNTTTKDLFLEHLRMNFVNAEK